MDVDVEIARLEYRLDRRDVGNDAFRQEGEHPERRDRQPGAIARDVEDDGTRGPDGRVVEVDTARNVRRDLEGVDAVDVEREAVVTGDVVEAECRESRGGGRCRRLGTVERGRGQHRGCHGRHGSEEESGESQ